MLHHYEYKAYYYLCSSYLLLFLCISCVTCYVDISQPLQLHSKTYIGDFVKHTSGLSYNPRDNVFYTVYDRESAIYQFSIAWSSKKGKTLSTAKLETKITIVGMKDVEAVSFDPTHQRLLATSEGKGIIHSICMRDIAKRKTEADIVKPNTQYQYKIKEAEHQSSCGMEGLTNNHRSGNLIFTNECDPTLLVEMDPSTDKQIAKTDYTHFLTRLNGLEYDPVTDRIWGSDASDGVLLLFDTDGTYLDGWYGFCHPFEGVTVNYNHNPPLVHTVCDATEKGSHVSSYILPQPDPEHGRWWYYGQKHWEELRKDVRKQCDIKCHPKGKPKVCDGAGCRRTTYKEFIQETLKMQPDYPGKDKEINRKLTYYTISDKFKFSDPKTTLPPKQNANIHDSKKYADVKVEHVCGIVNTTNVYANLLSTSNNNVGNGVSGTATENEGSSNSTIIIVACIVGITALFLIAIAAIIFVIVKKRSKKVQFDSYQEGEYNFTEKADSPFDNEEDL